MPTVAHGRRGLDPSGGWFHAGTAVAPWGPVQVATSSDALLGIAVLSPSGAFVDDVAKRGGRSLAPGASPFLQRAIEAVEAFLAGRPEALAALPIDLGGAGSWDRAVLGAVRMLRWGEVASYGEIARAIGRRGAARAVGGAVGRNPIGLAIPCHRVIAGDGTLGGYGGDWFGSRDDLLAIKRELLGREGIEPRRQSVR